MHLLGLIESIAKRKPNYIHRFATALARNEEQAVDAVNKEIIFMKVPFYDKSYTSLITGLL